MISIRGGRLAPEGPAGLVRGVAAELAKYPLRRFRLRRSLKGILTSLYPGPGPLWLRPVRIGGVALAGFLGPSQGKGDRMHIEGLEERANEKELVARGSSNKDLKNQKLAEFLRSRIEELDRRLAILNSERGRFEKPLDGVRRMDDTCAVATLTAISGWSWPKN